MSFVFFFFEVDPQDSGKKLGSLEKVFGEGPPKLWEKVGFLEIFFFWGGEVGGNFWVYVARTLFSYKRVQCLNINLH